MKAFLRYPIFSYFLAFAIIASFSLHLVELHHDHPHNLFGTGVQATFHGEDRKWSLLVSLNPSVFYSNLSVQISDSILLACVYLLLRRQKLRFQIRDRLREAFRYGILNPKIY